MRKLILAPMALACLIGTAAAQQSPTMNVGNFPATQPVTQSGSWGFGLTGPIPAGSNVIGGVTQSGTWTVGLAAGSNAIGSVLADLRVAGAAVSSGNPAPVSVGNFPATQAVSQSGAWSFGLSGPIPAGTNVIGSVTQSGGPWSVSGTVNAVQSGTWNVGLNTGSNNIGSVTLGAGSASIGTIGNAFAQDATVTARLGTLGQKAMVGSAPVTIASDQPSLTTKIDQTTPGSTNGVVVNNRTLWYAPTVMTAGLAASSTTFSSERDQGATVPSPYSFYRVLVNCNQTGSLNILAKNTPGSSTIAVAGTSAVTAGVPVSAMVPALFRVFQVQYVNGATAATNCTIVDGFTAN